MTRTSTAIGRIGESIAAHYLTLAGYRVVERNVRLGAVEIDLVARRGDLLCLVEVRLRRESDFGAAVETIGREKRRRLRRAAALYLAGHPAAGCRLDVVTIDRDESGLVLRHLEDAVR